LERVSHGERSRQPSAADPRPQRLTLQQLRYDERLVAVAPDVVHRTDIWMADESGGPRLVHEPREARRLARHRGRQRLYRDEPIGIGIVCPVDVAGAARPDQGLHIVAAEARAAEEGSGHTGDN